MLFLFWYYKNIPKTANIPFQNFPYQGLSKQTKTANFGIEIYQLGTTQKAIVLT